MYNQFLGKLAGAALALFLMGCGEKDESVALESINVSLSSVSLEVGEKQQLTATAVPADAEGVSFRWTSADESIAAVSDGLVTAIAEGSTTVIVRSGAVRTDVTVTVTLSTVPVTSFTVANSELDLALNSEPVQIVLNKTPENAVGEFAYVSNNTNVVTVSNTGLITVFGAGSAIITVSCGNLAPQTATVTVAPFYSLFFRSDPYTVTGDDGQSRTHPLKDMTFTGNEDGSVTLTTTGGDPNVFTCPIGKALPTGATATLKFEYKSNQEPPATGQRAQFLWCVDGYPHGPMLDINGNSSSGDFPCYATNRDIYISEATEWTDFSYDLASFTAPLPTGIGFGSNAGHFFRFDPVDILVGYSITIRNLRIEIE
ncbi:MAG: Ig-like domain-containing protein [Bacteroidales bacterium]|jgi:uncharacterized protein YjdB|nr:Ig-like domain-containing protein [Bacteroidales bacterium]